MTLLEKQNSTNRKPTPQKTEQIQKSDESSIENKFMEMFEQMKITSGFKVDNPNNLGDAHFEIVGSKDVITSITVLLAYIRYCINNNLKKDINVKIGYNKPANSPMNFTLNDELLEDFYPGEVVEIN